MIDPKITEAFIDNLTIRLYETPEEEMKRSLSARLGFHVAERKQELVDAIMSGMNKKEAVAKFGTLKQIEKAGWSGDSKIKSVWMPPLKNVW